MLSAFLRSHAQHQYRDKSGSVAVDPPAKVKCPDEKHVCLWERLVVEHPLSVVRIYSGALCALTVRLIQDAVSGRAMMKNQTHLTTWSDTDRGFLDFDWIGPWIAALSAVDERDADFVLYGTSNNCDKPQLRIAEYKDCLKFIRKCLRALHPHSKSSCRHVFNTAERQLN